MTDSMSDPEEEALLTEHRALARKTFEAGLSSAESRRLAYVRWQLDRIHEARDAGRLDELAALAALGERVAAHIDAFRQEVKGLATEATGLRLDGSRLTMAAGVVVPPSLPGEAPPTPISANPMGGMGPA